MFKLEVFCVLNSTLFVCDSVVVVVWLYYVLVLDPDFVEVSLLP